jgi:DNA-binding response OmpR family regulator
VKKHIVLIEDDLDMKSLLSEYLVNYNFEVSDFDKPMQALEFINHNKCDLVILDLMLPQMDGFDVCKKIRENSNIPIIISSARGYLGDKVTGFELGADDYLPKPYEPKELILRINAILRRMTKENKKIGDFEINEDKMEISLDDYLLDFTKVEYEILLLLLKNSDKVLSRESIAQSVNSLNYDSKERVIDMHISNIRNKIGDTPKNSKYIKSVWGVGYKFIG